MTTRIGVKGSDDGNDWVIYDKDTGRYLGSESKKDKNGWAKALEKATGFAIMLAAKDRIANVNAVSAYPKEIRNATYGKHYGDG